MCAVCTDMRQTRPDTTALGEVLHGGGDPCTSLCVDGVGFSPPIRITRFTPTASVRIFILLLITICGLKRDHIAGIKVSLNTTSMIIGDDISFSCVYIFIISLRGDVLSERRRARSATGHFTAIKIDFVNRVDCL